MSEVRNWLESIGLGQYADAFETNDIDMDLLGEIDDPGCGSAICPNAELAAIPYSEVARLKTENWKRKLMAKRGNPPAPGDSLDLRTRRTRRSQVHLRVTGCCWRFAPRGSSVSQPASRPTPRRPQ
jgi:hypothetical protein